MPKAQPTERNPLRFDMEKLLGNSKPAPQTFQQPTQTVEKSAFQPVQPTQTTQPVQPEPINIVEEPQPLPVMQEVKLEEAIIDAATIIRVILMHDIDAIDREKFLITLLNASLILLPNILNSFIIIFSFLVVFY